MFKNKNECTKISNGFFLAMGVLSFLSIISLLLNGKDAIEGYTVNDYYFNIIMFLIYAVASGLILLFTNKKDILYKDEYPISRRFFDLFVVISIMSMIITISSNVLSHFFYDNFSLYSLIIVLVGYVPAYIIAYKKVSEGILLSKDNETKVNVANFLIIYLLMQYYINIVAIISQMVLKMAEMKTLISSLCFSVIWVCIVVVAYKLINKKEIKLITKKNK